jgi:hypothetical protein
MILSQGHFFALLICECSVSRLLLLTGLFCPYELPSAATAQVLAGGKLLTGLELHRGLADTAPINARLRRLGSG